MNKIEVNTKNVGLKKGDMVKYHQYDFVYMIVSDPKNDLADLVALSTGQFIAHGGIRDAIRVPSVTITRQD